MSMLRKSVHGWRMMKKQEIQKLTTDRRPSPCLNPVCESPTRSTAFSSPSPLPPLFFCCQKNFQATISLSTSSFATGPLSTAAYYSRAPESGLIPDPNTVEDSRAPELDPNTAEDFTHVEDPNPNVQSLRESSVGDGSGRRSDRRSQLCPGGVGTLDMPKQNSKVADEGAMKCGDKIQFREFPLLMYWANLPLWERHKLMCRLYFGRFMPWWWDRYKKQKLPDNVYYFDQTPSISKTSPLALAKRIVTDLGHLTMLRKYSKRRVPLKDVLLKKGDVPTYVLLEFVGVVVAGVAILSVSYFNWKK